MRYQELPELVKTNVRGGVGEIRCRDYLSGAPDGLAFAQLGMNEMQPGSTIPEHTHAEDAEFYFILEGQGTGLHQGQSFPVGPGDGWLCRRGETHGILNNTGQPGQILRFLSIFFK